MTNFVTRWRSRLVAICAGLLLPLSLAPFGYWPLGFVSVALLFFVWERNPAHITSLGWFYGVGKYGLGASWVYISIHEHGNASVGLALFMVTLFVSGMALFDLAHGWAYGRLRQRSAMLVPTRAPQATNGLLFVGLWALWEWFLTWVLTGFPWLLLGNGHLPTALGNFAPVGGVLLVSLAAVATTVAATHGLWSALAASRVSDKQRPRMNWLWLSALVALVPWIVGSGLGVPQWVDAGAQRSVALVQNNILQRTKWDPEERQAIVDAQLRLSEPHWGVDVLVWPEAAITIFAHQAQPLFDQLQQRGQAAGTALVLGVPRLESVGADEFAFHNSAQALGAGQGHYVKRRLVPFGEYVPLEGLLRGLIEFFDLPMSRSATGPWQQPLLQLGPDLAAVAICYEIAYPGLVASHGGEAHVLLTLSNDSWFGGSIGPHQHLQIAQMRAKENGRYVLRATQSGVTAIIDQTGAVQSRLPQFQPGVLTGHYVAFSGATPFTRWGNMLVLALIVLCGVVVVSLRAFVTSDSQAHGHPLRPPRD